MDNPRRKRSGYLKAAVMPAGLLLLGIFLYRTAKYGLRYVLNGCPDSRDLPALGELLTEKEYESCFFAYIRIVPIEPHYQITRIDFEFDSFIAPETLIRESLEIRDITERYMQAHPEEFQEMRVRIEFHDKRDASPAYVRFLNFYEDSGSLSDSGRLVYGMFDLPGAEPEMLKHAGGFTELRLLDFNYPDDFSAFDGMDSLRKLEFNNDQNSGTHDYPPEILDAFAAKHPGCELSGSIRASERTSG